ncbi:MAG: glycyl-radical enzyme activating protein [Clostridia bacterium]
MRQTIAVTEIQRFSTHDGPGIRTVVFLPGCPLRCVWCHNPEAQTRENHLFYIDSRCIGCGTCAAVCPRNVHVFSAEGHLLSRVKCSGCGLCAEACPSGALENTVKYFTLEEIIKYVRRDEAFYGETGGMTLSGGEPLTQGGTCVALLKAAKDYGIGTAVETCGYAEEEAVYRAAEYTDLFLWDIKDTDPGRHREYTGAENEPILRNLFAADRAGANTLLRCILVRGVNTNAAHYERVAALSRRLRHCRGVQLLPYHAYGSSKAVQMGYPDPAHKEWIPTPEDLLAAKEEFKKYNINLI